MITVFYQIQTVSVLLFLKGKNYTRFKLNIVNFTSGLPYGPPLSLLRDSQCPQIPICVLFPSSCKTQNFFFLANGLIKFHYCLEILTFNFQTTDSRHGRNYHTYRNDLTEKQSWRRTMSGLWRIQYQRDMQKNLPRKQLLQRYGIYPTMVLSHK